MSCTEPDSNSASVPADYNFEVPNFTTLKKHVYIMEQKFVWSCLNPHPYKNSPRHAGGDLQDLFFYNSSTYILDLGSTD